MCVKLFMMVIGLYFRKFMAFLNNNICDLHFRRCTYKVKVIVKWVYGYLLEFLI